MRACASTLLLLLACAPPSPAAVSQARLPPVAAAATVASAVQAALPHAVRQADETPPSYALFERFPDLAVRLPRTPLTRLPTPVEPLRVEVAGGSAVRVFIKRDDLSAEPYGGGKARKLELLLGRALADGAAEVTTFGGVGSHHALATAIYGGRLGLKVSLHLLPQPPDAHVRRNLLALHHAGAMLHGPSGWAAAQRRARRQLAHAPADRPVQILPVGGSSPLANLSFVNAGLELAAQIERGDMPAPNEIYMALGTMGSAVGVAIGLKLAGVPSRVVAVRASNKPTSSQRKLDAMVQATLVLLRQLQPSMPPLTIGPEQLYIEGGYLGRGYAQPTSAGRRAAAMALQQLGLQLDATYTAKTFAALLDGAGRRPGHSAQAASSGRVVLYWHSHDAEPPPIGASQASDLPAAFRAYFKPSQ